MKSRTEMRLHCLTLANTLGVSKQIAPKDIVPTAMEFFRWVDDDPADTTDTSRMVERFRVSGRS